ncbi:MAG: serine/threonine protein kinase [Vicinamibacteria bacterium]|jgi:serine/threonine-protein kinase|nr:serine/threonine protein kinase [Vicinamibacteria bacterium]
MLAAGKKIGQYEIQSTIGQGASGTVFRAYDPTLNRTVALKIFSPELLHDQTFTERFTREAQIWGQLEHPAIVPVYHAGTEAGYPYIALRFIPGGSLDQKLQEGPLSIERALEILNVVATALDYAHSRGVVHRDVKPGNVLLDEVGHAYLSDFGIARLISSAADPYHTANVAGTPSYMAPEQARNQEPTPLADVYSLGCMAYEMLTGAAPFRGATVVDVMMQHIMAQPTPPTALAPHLPAHVEAAILKAMSKEPNERWPSAALFIQALRGLMNADSVHTISIAGRPISHPAARPKTTSRKRTWMALAAGALLAIALMTWIFWPAAPVTGPVQRPPDELKALLTAALRSMDEGSYPEALQVTELALRLYPGHPDVLQFRARVQRAWQAERTLGLWGPNTNASPPAAPPASPRAK